MFTYIWHRFMVNVGKYTISMDPMGHGIRLSSIPVYIPPQKKYTLSKWSFAFEEKGQCRFFSAFSGLRHILPCPGTSSKSSSYITVVLLMS